MTFDSPQTGSARSAESVVADRGVIYGTFTLSLDLAAPPDQVFAAFSDLSIRQRWFRIPAQRGTGRHELDFRVGGEETATGVFVSLDQREQIEYRSQFLDIVTDERIVFAYQGIVDGIRRVVSLVTVELLPDADGTLLRHTEQYALLAFTGDGSQDIAHLEGGTRLKHNGLAAVVENPYLEGTAPHRNGGL